MLGWSVATAPPTDESVIWPTLLPNPPTEAGWKAVTTAMSTLPPASVTGAGRLPVSETVTENGPGARRVHVREGHVRAPLPAGMLGDVVVTAAVSSGEEEKTATRFTGAATSLDAPVLPVTPVYGPDSVISDESSELTG